MKYFEEISVLIIFIVFFSTFIYAIAGFVLSFVDYERCYWAPTGDLKFRNLSLIDTPKYVYVIQLDFIKKCFIDKKEYDMNFYNPTHRKIKKNNISLFYSLNSSSGSLSNSSILS